MTYKLIQRHVVDFCIMPDIQTGASDLRFIIVLVYSEFLMLFVLKTMMNCLLCLTRFASKPLMLE